MSVDAQTEPQSKVAEDSSQVIIVARVKRSPRYGAQSSLANENRPGGHSGLRPNR